VSALVSALNAAAGKVPQIVDVLVAPTFLHIDSVMQSLKQPYLVSAQNHSATGPGAYTGEISADQLADFGVKWTILGHSERRQLYHTTDEVVAKQVSLAEKHGLKIIACIGETLEERKADKTVEVVTRQMKAIGDVVKDWSNIVVAYEPVWAIGTGLTATPQQAQETHASIRAFLAKTYGQAVATSTRIIYGGSVKGNNADSLISEKDIDGFLVGGASLVADEFVQIFTSPIRAKL
jgi:triosephosphate isomerase